MIILLAGPPGSGKSSQSRLLSDRLGIPRVSSSDTMRMAAAEGDPTAVEALRIIRDGSLAPSSTISGLMKRRLSREDCESGAVVDGYPRKAEEANALLSFGVKPDICFVLNVSAGRAIERVRSRGGDGHGRQDWTDEAIARRLSIYAAEHSAVISELSLGGVETVVIDADGDVESVYLALRDRIAELPRECFGPSPGL